MLATAVRLIRRGGAKSLRYARHYLRDVSGSYAVVFALASPALIGFAGLMSEGGLWFYKHQTLQGAADAAALSAATRYGVTLSDDLTTQAESVVAAYGYPVGTNGTTVTVHKPPTSGNYTANTKAVEVLITTTQPRLLSAIFSNSSITLNGRAVATVAEAGKGCVLALNASASSTVTSQGSSNINLSACGVYDNSTSSTAMVNGGSATINADTVNVVGGLSGGSGITATAINTNVNPTPDPYASVTPPAFSGCGGGNNLKLKDTVTLDPGVYCNGIQLNAGAVVTLNPGVYYLDRGNLAVNGGATLTGTGVTLIFTSSTGSNYADATINGGATVNLVAPTTGTMAGIVIFGDRNMPTDTTLRFNGGSTQIFGGAVYVPHGALNYSGGASAGTNCTQLIGDTVSFTGNSDVAINCAGYGTKPLGLAKATLVE